jgi:hypothetical protein
MGTERNRYFLNFQLSRVIVVPQEDIVYVKKSRESGVLSCVVFLCILGKVIQGTILSETLTISPEGTYKISESYVS